MTLSSVLNAAVSGLTASQAGLSATSTNIANANTPGYARNRIDQTTGVTAGRVSGVIVGEPTRIADRFLELSVFRRGGALGQAQISQEYLDRVQSLLGTPGSEAGLPNRLDEMAAKAIAMTAPGAASETTALFVGSVQDAITSIQQMGRDVADLRNDAETEIGDTVDRVNALLRQVHDLNNQVASLDGLGRSSSGAADVRNTAIEELSQLVEIVPRLQPSGRVNLDTKSGAALLDTRLRQISYPPSGNGALAAFPAITIRFAEPDGTMGAATGETINSSAIGGKLGGLLDLRDRALPNLAEELGTLMMGMAEGLNGAANAATLAPPPRTLEGRITGLVGGDRLGFTGQTQFAVTDSNGRLVASTTVDFDALGAGATINDAIAAINTGLGGAATASFAGNRLTITAASATNGVALADLATDPASRGGVGFSHFFGLNDLLRSSTNPLIPAGFTAADPHGFAAGSTVSLQLRDPTGRSIGTQDVVMAAGGTMGDVLNSLQSGPLAAYGTFSIDDRGRFRFAPAAALSGSVLSFTGDNTNRLGTGLGFTQLSGLSNRSMPLDTVSIKPEIANSPLRLPVAVLQQGVAVGQTAVGGGDRRGVEVFVSRINARLDLGKDGMASLPEFTARMVTSTSRQAGQASARAENTALSFDDAVNRRNSFSGVNIDEELAGMVILQNSYAASARVLSTAKEMYDTLLGLLR